MANDKPVTRKERFLAGAAGEDITLDTPITREERFLAKAAGMDVKTDDPVTRSEKYLAKIAEGGGGSVPEYEGSYTVTPSTSAQTLETDGKKMTDDVTIQAVPTGTAGTPTATKGAVSNHSVDVTPSVTNTTGYITGSTINGMPVTVTVAELESGTKEITANGTNIDVSGYSAVDVDVPTGGGTAEASMKDVNFYDYDGTRLYSYTAQEFLALSAMPANPTHTGLTAQGWNWSLADAKEQVSAVGACDIGQHYITDDGKTRIYISILGNTLSLSCGFALNGTAIIDWGDGSSPETVSGGNSTVNNNNYFNHTYNATGDYVITVDIKSGSAQIGKVNTNYSQLITTQDNAKRDASNPYVSLVKKIEIGNNISIVEDAGLSYMTELESVTIPISLANSDYYDYCNGLRCIICNPAQKSFFITNKGGYLDSLRALCFSRKVVSVFNRWLGRTKMKRFVQSLDCTSMLPYPPGAYAELFITPNITSVSGVSSVIPYVRFCPLVPPTASSSSVFGTGTTSVYLVPFASLADYLTATNYPSPATLMYCGFGTFADQTALPSQDTTQAYNVTWYATKEDAIAQTNAITVGNGNEVYCRYTAV